MDGAVQGRLDRLTTRLQDSARDDFYSRTEHAIEMCLAHEEGSLTAAKDERFALPENVTLRALVSETTAAYHQQFLTVFILVRIRLSEFRLTVRDYDLAGPLLFTTRPLPPFMTHLLCMFRRFLQRPMLKSEEIRT